MPVFWFGRRPPWGRIAPPAIGAPWGRAGTRRAPHLRGCVPRTGWRPPGSGRWRGALSCPAPAPRSLLPEDRESGLLFSPKDKLARESPHRPAARKADVNGDASLRSERQGDPDPSGAPALRACSRLGSGVCDPRGVQPGECALSLVKVGGGCLAVGTGPRVLDLNKKEGRPSLFSPPDFKHCWTWQWSLLRDPRLRVFSIPKLAAPKRQTEEPANGRTQSVNFVFARHSQPVCDRFSRVPPSVSGAPFWQHEDEHYLSPSCVWHRYFFSLERLCTHFDLSCHKAGVSARQSSAMAIRRGSPTVFGSSEWVGSPRHDTLAEPSAILSVASRWFPSGSACSLNGAQNFKEPPRTSPPGLRDDYFPSNNLARRCSSALHRALSGAGERHSKAGF